MLVRYLISLGAILVAVLLVLGERFLLIHRAAELSTRRFDAVEASLTQIDRVVKNRNDRGDFFRYLGARPGKDPDLAELNPAPRIVETAVLMDRNFVALARSGRDLDEAERQLVRRGMRHAVTPAGILRSYILTDFENRGVAYLALIVNPVSPDKTTALYAASFDFQTIAAIDKETFGHEENLLLAALLSRQTADRQVIRLHGTSYVSLRRYVMDANMVLFELTALAPLYTFFSPYLLLLVLVVSMVWILRAHAANRYTRREMSERILHSYSRAIDAQTSALGELARLTESDASLREKLVSETGRHMDIEERLRQEREERKMHEPKGHPIVIDIMPEERQFRFMNPARTVVPASGVARLGEKEQKIRERAFSDELRGLMQAMESPAESDALPEISESGLEASIDAFTAKYRFPAIDQYLYYLNELYFDEVTGDEVAQAMRVAGDAVQSHEFAILLYDVQAAAFRCGFVQGVPPDVMQTLYLLPKDSVIPSDSPDYSYTEVSPALRKNPFFAKRFPAGFPDNLKGIHVFSVSESFLRARVLFFDTTRGGALQDADVISSVKSYLRQVAPAIHMYFTESAHTEGNAADLAEWSVRELRESIALSDPDRPLMISQYVFENSLPLDQQLTLVREITKVLLDGEKVLVLSPARLTVAHAAGSGKAIEDLVGAQGRRYIVKESEFGKRSRNLYTFTEF